MPQPPILLQHGFSASTFSEWVECGNRGKPRHPRPPRHRPRCPRPRALRKAAPLRATMARCTWPVTSPNWPITSASPASTSYGYSMGGRHRHPSGNARAPPPPRPSSSVSAKPGADRRCRSSRVLATDELAACLRAPDPTGFSPIAQAFRAGAVARPTISPHSPPIATASADRVIDFAAITPPLRWSWRAMPTPSPSTPSHSPRRFLPARAWRWSRRSRRRAALAG